MTTTSGCSSAIRFKANLDRGGTVEHVGVRRFEVGSFDRLFWFQLNYPGELGGKFPSTYRDIVFEDFKVGDVGTLFEGHAPPEAPLEGCAPFACGLATGIGAALYTARVEAGSTCVVFGCGLVGLGAVIGARLAGADRIIAIDLSESRLEQARHHGATDTRTADDSTVDWVRAETGGFGADYTFEATGNVQVMRQAVEAAREAWGLATMVGVAGKGETLDIVPRFLITGRRVTGSSFGGVKGRTQVPQLVDRWLAGEIDVESLLSHRLALDEVNRGFDLMEAQDGIRSVIVFD